MMDGQKQRIGDYEVLGVLGAGGMGKVYRVRNVISDRVEAMKILLPSLSDHREVGERFLREIKLVASLHHPNIANLCTAQTVENHLIMVMEFVDGETFSDLLDRRAVPLPEALNYFDQALAALGYAHSRGIVHRDVKPSNIMLTPDGAVKLMDFGIARSDVDRALTQTGATIGTVSYMSPEQIAGRPVDGRSDLYSMGIFLYETVTGEQPFKGTSDYELMAAHMKEQPRPPAQVVPGIPDALNDIILKLLAKDPVDRFQSADEVREAVHRLAEFSSSSRGLPRAAPAHHPTVVEAAGFPSRFPDSGTVLAPAGAGGAAQQRTMLQPGTPGTLLRDTYTDRRMTEVSSIPSYGAPPISTLSVRKKGLARHPVLYAGVGLAVAAGAASPVIYGRRSHDRDGKPGASAAVSASPAVVASAATGRAGTSPGAPPANPNRAGAHPNAAEARPGLPLSTSALRSASVPGRAPVQAGGAGANDRPEQPPPGTGGALSGSGRASVAVGSAGAAAVPAPAISPELQAKLDDEEVHIDQIASRATGINNSLNGMQRSMAADGLSLRGDIATRQASMNTSLSKAKQALLAHDAARAARFAALAQADADALAAFLGR